MDSMTLALPDPDKSICVLTNASDRFYACLVTQIDEKHVLPPPDQFSRNSYVADNSCLLVSGLPSLFYTCLRIETSTYTNVKE
jgi:hypothetical protein